MQSRTKTILLATAGVIGVTCVILIAAAVFFFRSAIENTRTSQEGADQAFAEALIPFSNQKPLLEIARGEVVLTRDIPAVRPAESVTTLHVLAWEPAEDSLSRIHLPMWLVRMSDDPIAMQIDQNAGEERHTPLRPEDIDRFGPALLVDHMEADGARVMVWTQ